MNYLWPSEQFVSRRVASDYALDAISVLVTQVDALFQKINVWGDNAFPSPFVTCEVFDERRILVKEEEQ
ncbi:Uncharacterized protein TCM_039928 [Theobroma cacao]|uniref:Uncharacterized protein n=1 Tax=Theobroma cacao TaxID=3641 RepID=A0A061GSX5_THECC|nr:Uncharacterized protein TCM_039928 [Theobroma cacao]